MSAGSAAQHAHLAQDPAPGFRGAHDHIVVAVAVQVAGGQRPAPVLAGNGPAVTGASILGLKLARRGLHEAGHREQGGEIASSLHHKFLVGPVTAAPSVIPGC